MTGEGGLDVVRRSHTGIYVCNARVGSALLDRATPRQQQAASRTETNVGRDNIDVVMPVCLERFIAGSNVALSFQRETLVGRR